MKSRLRVCVLHVHAVRFCDGRKVKLQLVFLLAIIALGPARLFAESTDPSRDLLGTWEISPVFQRRDGKGSTEQREKLTFDSEFFIITKAGQPPIRGTYTIYPNSNPMRINVKYLNGPDAGKLLHGIFSVNPGGLMICFSLDPKDESPKEYRTDAAKTLNTFYIKSGVGQRPPMADIVAVTFDGRSGAHYDPRTRALTGTREVSMDGLSWIEFLDHTQLRLISTMTDHGWKVGAPGTTRGETMASFQLVADKSVGGILWLFVSISKLPDKDKAGIGYVQLDR